MKRTVTFERHGLDILAHTERGTEKLYSAILEPDGRYNIVRFEDGRQEIVMARADRDAAERSLDEVVETLGEFAGARV